MTGSAPIVLFVFARPDHTRATLEALAANRLADQSDLVIYADAARSENDLEHVKAVRNLARSAKGFRSLTVIERETNYGLARNIIEGVTEVCNRYGRVIVLEDDIVTSPYFLTFMNAALDRYEKTPKVWHISGWNYPIDAHGLDDAFFWRAMNCWGWGTWSDRWSHYRKNPERLVSVWSREKIRRFNLEGAHNFWEQVTSNHSGRLDTWAIFWYATIFEHDGLCLNPSIPLTVNIGNDGSGENCGNTAIFSNYPQHWTSEVTLPVNMVESPLAVERIRNFYRQMTVDLLKGAARKLLNRFKRQVS